MREKEQGCLCICDAHMCIGTCERRAGVRRAGVKWAVCATEGRREVRG